MIIARGFATISIKYSYTFPDESKLTAFISSRYGDLEDVPSPITKFKTSMEIVDLQNFKMIQFLHPTCWISEFPPTDWCHIKGLIFLKNIISQTSDECVPRRCRHGPGASRVECVAERLSV